MNPTGPDPEHWFTVTILFNISKGRSGLSWRAPQSHLLPVTSDRFELYANTTFCMWVTEAL